MTNLSRLTRAEQVLERLRQANGDWVDGAELATAQVGGSEGLKRLRELRDAGHDIRKRKKLNSAQWQYRLVPHVSRTWDWQPLTEVYPTPQQQAAEFQAERDAELATITDERAEGERFADEIEAYENRPLPEPAEKYDYTPPVVPGKAHLGIDEHGRYVMVRDGSPSPQTTAFGDLPVEGGRFTEMPTYLELGVTVPCPVCHGHRRKIKRTGRYEEKTRDPIHTEMPCRRCNGFGLVPR